MTTSTSLYWIEILANAGPLSSTEYYVATQLFGTKSNTLLVAGPYLSYETAERNLEIVTDGGVPYSPIV